MISQPESRNFGSNLRWAFFILRFREMKDSMLNIQASLTYFIFWMKQALLKELHNPKITNKTFISNATKSSFGCQGRKFLLGPFLPSWVLSHHKHIKLRSALRKSANIWYNWKNCIHNNYLSIIWSSVVAVFQQLQAMFIIPIMKYPLQS